MRGRDEDLLGPFDKYDFARDKRNKSCRSKQFMFVKHSQSL